MEHKVQNLAVAPDLAANYFFIHSKKTPQICASLIFDFHFEVLTEFLNLWRRRELFEIHYCIAATCSDISLNKHQVQTFISLRQEGHLKNKIFCLDKAECG